MTICKNAFFGAIFAQSKAFLFLILMSKVLLLDFPQLLDIKFLQTDLGQLYQSIPFEELVQNIPLPPQQKTGKGCKPWFTVQGGFALLVLKHYLQLSDEMLIQRINTDWSMQRFCGIALKPNEVIKDKNLPSFWRIYIGKHLNIEELNIISAKHWSPYIQHQNISSADATCYESYVNFPTPIKIVWDSCNKTFCLLQHYRKQLKQRDSRCNYEKYRALFTEYQKTKKKSKRKEKKLLKKLLKFLYRLTELLTDFTKKHKIVLSHKQANLLKDIATVYEQQYSKVYGKVDVIKDRIVSLSKPYIRPIVRGKENKPVEFGAKVNKLQVDGISFIEHFSYNAFNEGTRLKEGIHLHRKLFGPCTHHSADKIYATNANRSYCKEQNIVTNFVPKGKEKQAHVEQGKAIRKALNKQRASVLEGSFGNEKNHFLLHKIKAKNADTEKCWIFFGIFTANASIITNRREALKKQAAKKAA